MTELVATLGTGKGTWGYLKQLVATADWESVLIVTNSFGAERFSIVGKELFFAVVDDRKDISELVQDIYAQLRGGIKGTEVALNIVSGEGKMHMALLSALLKLGLGVRLVGIKNGIIEEI